MKSIALLILAGAAFLFFTSLLVWMISAFFRSNRRQFVADGPLVEEQTFELPEPAVLLLLLEVPRFGSDFRQLEFQLIDRATGDLTTLRYNALRAQGTVYGMSTMRVPIGRFAVAHPGAWLLRVVGLPAGVSDSRSRVIISRPYIGRMAAQITVIVLCAIGMLLSLVFALWQVLPLAES